MYVFALVGLGAGLLWVAFERPAGTALQLASRYGAVSYGIYALLTGAFWVGSPAMIAELVPGSNAGALVVAIVQARGVIVFGLGVLSLAGRNWAAAGWKSVLIGPVVYNVLLACEALAAQFTVLSTPERWLYVALHSLWALSIGIRFASGQREVGHTTYDVRASSSTRAARRVLAGFGVLFFCTGVLFLLSPASIMPRLESGSENAFAAHALHALGSAFTAIAAVAYTVSSTIERMHRKIGLVVLLVTSLSLAILALIYAVSLGPLEVPMQVLAALCLLVFVVSCLELRPVHTRE